MDEVSQLRSLSDADRRMLGAILGRWEQVFFSQLGRASGIGVKFTLDQTALILRALHLQLWTEPEGEIDPAQDESAE